MASGYGYSTTNISQILDLAKINMGTNIPYISTRPGFSSALLNSPTVQNSTLKKAEGNKRRRSHRKAKDKKSEKDNDDMLNIFGPIPPMVCHLQKNSPPNYYIPPSRRRSFTEDKVTTDSSRRVDGQNEKSLVDEKVTFKIQPMKNQVGSRIIRKRNPKYKHVNLKSFLKNDNTGHCLFTTITNNLMKSFDKLNIDVPKNNVMSKAESRKFPKNKLTKKKMKKTKSIEVDETPYPDYMSKEDVMSGLGEGSLIKGFVRINPKNSQDSYVSNDDSSKADYYLTSVMDRNRALEGDEVILQLKPENEWIDGKITVQVVHIIQKIHSRLAVGILKPRNTKNSEYAIFHPRDRRCPHIRIPESNWPNGFKDNPKNYSNTLCTARILQWTVPPYATGVLIESLGQVGDLKVETLSILKEFCLDTTPFGDEVEEYLPKNHSISKEEIEKREDIRKECVFTIDPATARDLDDAVSVKILSNGNYEVGVHISDVGYYLEQGTELDQKVCKKATTIYMVDSVYHMLPVELCLHCSLLPGQDKLAFSVFWEMTAEGEILSKRYTRTVINSCSKLAYEHAQHIIENPDEFSAEGFPDVHNGFKPEDIANTVNILQSIAVRLREKRVANGALKIDQVKLYFSLDAATGEPVEYSKYENKESHRLIEEFMLLANISVAEKINDSFPDMAFLRCHEQPKQTMLVDLQNNLATYGIHVDISSSIGIRTSLEKYISSDYPGLCRAAVLNHLVAKAMTRARYFCAATMESDSYFDHYALSVPIYTHFTSPIRRYADIMVHRLLAASLNYQDPPAWDEPYISAIASNCNMQKYNAKRAGEASMELYLGHYIEKHKPFEQDCVVVDVKERNFDVIVLKTGSIVRIYPNNCEQGTLWKIEHIVNDRPISKEFKVSKEESGRKQLRLTITFPKTKYFPRSKIAVEMFSVVKVNLEKKQNTYKLEGTLVRPLPERVFIRQQ